MASKYTQDQIEKLLSLPENAYLNKKAEDKYKDFSKNDPFPEISDSLLNSKDIIKYILTVGMVCPFKPENLTSATYTCDFSGRYVFWDDDNVQRKGTLGDDETLILRPNSITFLEINPIFRVPEYMVLRFNLQVRNVYKGLLLGTGPVVDPGFVGKLFIPLHNLTSNEYVISKNANLISVEFTKLSKYSELSLSKKSECSLRSIAENLRFDDIPYMSAEITPCREIEKYTEKALQKDGLFYKKDKEIIHINSSMDKITAEMKDAIEEMNKTRSKYEVSMKKVQASINKVEDRVERRDVFQRNIFAIAVIGMMISIIVLFISAYQYFSEKEQLFQKIQSIEAIEKLYEENKLPRDKTAGDWKAWQFVTN